DSSAGTEKAGYRRTDPNGIAAEADRTAEPHRAGDSGKAQAQAVWNDTKASVRSALNETQQSTAADIHDFAAALKIAARSLERRGPAGRVAEQAADSLERLSGKLRSKDFDGLVHDVEAFARSQPAVFLGMAVAAGFLAARFLKSSSPYSADRPEEGLIGRSPAGPQQAPNAVASTFPYDSGRP
ncbi:MAG: hypothetical protein ACT4P8_05375, partial [Betaproteobacteria bacterium]